MENLENREKINKETIKSRLEKYGKKILEAGGRHSLKEKARKAVVWSSIILTMLGASSELSPTSKEEFAELFKKGTKKQEFVLKENKTLRPESQIFRDFDKPEILLQGRNEEDTNSLQQAEKAPEEQGVNRNLAEESEGKDVLENKGIEEAHFSEMFQDDKEIILGKEEFQHLFRHSKEAGMEINQERIETELNLLKSASDVLNEKYGLKAGEIGEFKMAERAKSQIEEANDIFERIIIQDKEEINKFRVKLWEKGKSMWQNLAGDLKLTFAGWGLSRVALVNHELGHLEEGIKQNANIESFKISLSPKITGIGSVKYSGKVKSPEAIDAAGINASKKLHKFIVEGLRSGEENNQILALLGLMSGCDGFRYALVTKMGLLDSSIGDLEWYSKDTKISINKIYLGLAADFFLNSDNLTLIRMALGNEKIKFSDCFWRCYYDLKKSAPETGIKIGYDF